MRRAAPAVLALALLGLPARGAAQQGATQVIDRIAAVVGERIILMSEIDEQLAERRQQGLEIPDDSAALHRLRRVVLQDLIDEEVLFAAARRDTSVQVTDQEVQQAVDEQYRQMRGNFAGEAELRRAFAESPFGSAEEWRRRFAEVQRRQAYRDRYVTRLRQEGKLRSGAVSEADLRAAYDVAVRQRGGVPRYPPTITFRQIVIAPRPTEDARARALVLAESVKVELDRGADFAAAARRFSGDPTSREQGGDLGWFRRETMVREFATVAFALRPGAVSPPVRTTYGYHLILVERIQPAEVKARHILFAPAITETDLAAAQALADSLAALVRGGASADSLARVHADSAEARLMGPVDRTRLDSAFVRAFDGVEAGAIVGPFPVSPDGSASRTRLIVAQVTDVQPERDYTFEDAREELRTQVQRQRSIQNLIESLKRHSYVDVRY